MTTLMQDAAAWLGEKLQAAGGRTVVLCRGSQKSDSLTATVTAHSPAMMGEDAFETTFTVYDWTFTTSELPWEIKDGQRIREVLNAVEYEVLPLPDRKSVEPMDSSGVLTVVHTKRVK